MRILKVLHIIDARAMRAIFCERFFNIVFQFLNKSEYHLNRLCNIHLNITLMRD